MKRWPRAVVVAAFLCWANSGALACAAAPAEPGQRIDDPLPAKKPSSLAGTWHSIKVTPPPDLPKIHWYNKLNPVWWFRNADEPLPPDWYKPNDKRRVLKYHLRNSFHNFTFYVIGIADKALIRSGRYPTSISNPNGGWNFAVSKYKCLSLPFVSYRRGWLEFYFGWRERGNFGIKVNIKRPPPKPG